MTDANGPDESASRPGEPDTAAETVRERLQRMRTGGAEEPPPERPPPAGQTPRVARKEPGRRVREQQRTAAVREPPPQAPTRGSPTSRRTARAAPKRDRTAPTGPEAGPVVPAAPEGGPVTPAGPEGSPEPQAEPAVVADPGAQADSVGGRLAARLAALRAERGWSLQDLARRSGVSRSNLSRIERGEISPTAEVLVRLATAYQQALSGLVAEVEAQPRSLVRAAEQAVTGEDAWRQRVVSPPYPGLAGSVTDAQLLPGTDVTYDPPQPGAEQHLWLITGSLEVTLTVGGTAGPAGPGSADAGPPGPSADGGEAAGAGPAGVPDDDPERRAERAGDFVLIRGDCLRLRLWGPARLRCLSPDPARYALFTVAPAPVS